MASAEAVLRIIVAVSTISSLWVGMWVAYRQLRAPSAQPAMSELVINSTPATRRKERFWANLSLVRNSFAIVSFIAYLASMLNSQPLKSYQALMILGAAWGIRVSWRDLRVARLKLAIIDTRNRADALRMEQAMLELQGYRLKEQIAATEQEIAALRASVPNPAEQNKTGEG